MVKKKGSISKESGVKFEIIKFIIENNGPVKESQIREHLKKKNEKINQGNINKHLHHLCEELACIELTPPAKKGLFNQWDIKTIENLKNIRLKFTKLPLNKYKKSINIVFEKRYSDVGFFTTPDEFRIQLLLSISFFDMCLKTDIQTLYEKAYKIDKFGEGFKRHERIKKYTNEIYTECMKCIPVNSNIWLTIYEECIREPLKSDILRNSLRSFPNPDKISEDEFYKILEIMPFNLPGEESEEKWYLFVIERLSNIIAIEMHTEMLKKAKKNLEKIPMEVFSKISNEIERRISESMFKKMTDENSEEIHNKISEIKFNQRLCISMIPHVFFEHCFQRDVLDDTISPEEEEFMYEVKKFHIWFSKETKKDAISALQAKDNFYTECLNKYQKL